MMRCMSALEVDRQRPLTRTVNATQPLAARTRAALRGLAGDPALRRAVVIVVVLRLGLGLVGWLSLVLRPGDPRGTALQSWLVPPGGMRWALLGPWQRDDGLWYQLLASHGYSHGGPDNAFFPLYPAVTHVVGVGLGGDYATAAMLVSTLALVGALTVLHHLFRFDLEERTTRLAVLLVALSPTAFFFLAPYTESLFLLLSAGSFLAVRRHHLGLAGVLAALAALCRVQGAILVVPLAYEALVDIRRRRHLHLRAVSSGHAVVALPLVALGAFLLYGRLALGLRGGALDAASRFWHIRTVAPWSALFDSLRAIPVHPEEMFNLLSCVLLVVAVPLLWRMNRSYALYAAAAALPACFREDQFSPLMSASRYVAVVFPLFMLAAVALKDRAGLRRDVLVLSAAMMAARFVDFAHFHLVA